MARPTLLTDEVIAKICEALRTGNTRRASAEYAGISERTLFGWLETAKAENAEPEFLQFLQSIKKAEADCEVSNVAVIKKAATGHDVLKRVTKTSVVGGQTVTETTETVTREYYWQAAAWWLERRRPDDYKPRSSVENVDVRNLSDEDLERLTKG